MSIARFHVIFSKRYPYKLLDIFGRSSVIALWPLTEASGITAYDISGNNRHGVYSGVTLANALGPRARMAPLWDGVNDFCSVYSASLAAAFNPNAGTLLIWGKVLNAGVWTDATSDFMINFGVDGFNYVRIVKWTTANTLTPEVRLGTLIESNNIATAGNLGWFQAGLTWDKAADQFKSFYNGAQSGATQTSLGTWAGALGATLCNIGAQTTAGATPWNGWLQYSLLMNRAATPTEISRAFNAR